MSTLLAARTDANQASIVRDLRAAGCMVLSLHRVGDGCPDLLVWSPYTRRLHLLEVKRFDWKPPTPRAKKSRTQIAQEAFALRWPVTRVQTSMQAFAAVGVTAP